ncbi:haloacetate dehalogenase [Serratia fonticola]|uniref:Haloacetate dehalogenase n=1 Tax=Serratia fonticola TaxID=47917 RepID=A0A542D898_SERFO|nr:alpha/beta hydrolase [Serratia fonticola]TQI78667.1 haloacetate dehalogenase [Serratia fonticola]TQI99311.1 haloacetate dehalogenase [Serratia fonticola]TVZ68836.1 haloacetate dehalogenase [Serratia fonticola]
MDNTIITMGESPFIPGFTLQDVTLSNGVKLRVAIGGQGAPLVLLHGHPQNHVTWRKIAPALAKEFTVIMPDLRGYGDSSKPPSDPMHRNYSKKVMAEDIVLLMDQLGYDSFRFAGHDRGGRVGHRLALDYPQRVKRCVFIDIAPTATMYALTDKAFATRYFWWFFLIQPAPLPEKLIASDPEFFLQRHIDGQIKITGSTEPDIFAEYLRCYRDPEMLRAICEDYRAAATIDLEDDTVDSEKRILCPLQLLWGEKGTVGQLYDVIGTWQDKANNVEGTALPCGHAPHEEVPEKMLAVMLPFLKG